MRWSLVPPGRTPRPRNEIGEVQVEASMQAEPNVLVKGRKSMIMNRRRVPRVTTFIASTLIVLTAHAQSAPKANPLETRAKEFARAVSTGRPEELKQLAETFGGYLPYPDACAHRYADELLGPIPRADFSAARQSN